MNIAYQDRVRLMASRAMDYPMAEAIKRYLADMNVGDETWEDQYAAAIKVYDDATRSIKPEEEIFCQVYITTGDAADAYRAMRPQDTIDDDRAQELGENVLRRPVVETYLLRARWLDNMSEKDILRNVAEIVCDRSRPFKPDTRLKAAETYFKHVGAYQGDGDSVRRLSDEELAYRIQAAGMVRQPSALDALEVKEDFDFS